MLDRLRFILAIIASMAALFVLNEWLTASHPLGTFIALRMGGVVLPLVGWMALRRRWAERWAQPLAIAIVAAAYVYVAAAGLASPTGEYLTTTILFVGAALLTATVLPWGLWPQVTTVAVGAVALAAVVAWTDGSLAVATTDPAVVVMMGLALSVVIAGEFDRYRTAHRRELEERRNAEAQVRQLNAVLEARVAERTQALQNVNDRLAAEISERRRINDSLIASERLLADTVDHSAAIVALKGLTGRYLLVNREFERLFGRPRQTIVGQRDDDLFPAALAARLQAHDADVLARGEQVSFEQLLPSRDGDRTYVTVKFPLRGADGKPYGVGSMSTDISAVTQLQEAVRRHQDELAHVLRLHTIHEMAAAVAHEIHQPLGVITNYAQGGARRLRAGTAQAGDLLLAFEQIAVEGLRAGRILRGIRTFVRRDASEDADLDMRALAGEAVRMLEPEARLHGVTVRLEEGDALPRVRGNPIHIEQVLVNLMLNGVQAVAAGDRAEREVVVAATRGEDSIEVAVRDSGAGIAAEIAGRLFTPFVSTKPRGLGLGLAISRTIVETHGGRVWATNRPVAGASFHFTLPLDGAGDHYGAT